MGYRQDELRRQQVHRAKRRLEGADEGPRHAPPSGGKRQELQGIVGVLVDRALDRSRATLVRDLAEIVALPRESLADTG